MGANGTRPLLGGRGVDLNGAKGGAAKGKPVDVKGAAAGLCGKGLGPGAMHSGGVGACAGAHADALGKGCNDEVDGNRGRPKGAWTKPPVIRDADGYELVQPRRVRLQTDDGAAGKGEQQVSGVQGGLSTGRRWSDDDSDDDQLDDEDDTMEDGGDQGGYDESAATPEQLRTEYEAHARAVRDMEKKGKTYQGSPALETLRAARDAAERAWRNAKAPAPLPTRMGRAEAKLERAYTALTKARFAIEEFDGWAEQQRAELLQREQEADRWVRWRQQQLDELHQEAGGRVSGKKTGTAGTGHGAAVSGRIKDEFLPELQALIEHAQGNPEIIEKLTFLATGLESAGQALELDQAGAAECYDIADDGSDWPTGGDGRYDGDAMDDDRGDRRGHVNKTEWQPEGAGRWTRRSPPTSGGAAASASSASAAMGGQDAGTRGAHGAGTDGNAAGGGGGRPPPPTQTDEQAATSDGERSSKHRRTRTDAESREESDRRRALELLQEQQAAMEIQVQSHQAGTGGFASEAALSLAAQQFVAEVRKAEDQARKRGIEARAGEKALLELAPAELRQWINENLGDEADWK